MTTLNLYTDPLPSLGSAFTHALASVVNTRDVEHDVAIRANEYINDLQSNPRGVEVVLWLLENFSSIPIQDPDYFLFAILNTLSRSLINAKTVQAQNGGQTTGYCRSWLTVMSRAKDLIDNGLFGPRQNFSDVEKTSLQTVAEKIITTPYIAAKLHQVIGFLYVPFGPSEWTCLNAFIMEHFQYKMVTLAVVSLLAGSLLELCANLSAESGSSQFAQRKIDKNTRINRVKELADLIALFLRIPTSLRSENAQLTSQTYVVVTKLLAEYANLLVSVQMPALLENPTQLHFKLWMSPEVLENTNTVLSTTEDLQSLIRTICISKIKRDSFYERLSAPYQLELMEQAIQVLKMILESLLAKGVDWNDSDMLTIMQRIQSSLNYIVTKCRNRNWRSHLNTLYIVLIGLHVPEQQIFIRSTETLSVLLSESAGKSEASGTIVSPILSRTSSVNISQESTQSHLAAVESLYNVAFKIIIYRLIKVTDLSVITNPSDLHQTFLDSAVASLIRSNLQNHMGLQAANFSDLTSWKNHVIDATLAVDDTDDDLRVILSSQACSIRSCFKSLARSLANAGGVHWQMFATSIMTCIDEWISNDAFKSSLTYNYVIPNAISTKLKGFVSPCYTIMDAIGTILFALSEVDNPLTTQLGEQTLGAIVNHSFTWIDEKVSLNAQNSRVDIVLVDQPKTALGSHWHWIEWRRLEIIKQCANLTMPIRETIILPHLLKRIYLDTPEPWLVHFPTGDIEDDEEDIFYLTRRKACGALASAYTHCISSDREIARPHIEKVINLLVARLSNSARPLSSSEQHIIIESIISLTSALNNCELSKRALNLMIGQTFSECKSVLETINASTDEFRKAFFGADIKSCCDRRRQLCRQLFSLDTITTSLTLPSTFDGCLTGGFVKSADPAQVTRHRQNVTTLYPLMSETSEQYADLFLSYEAPQDLYALSLLPLLLTTFSRLIELYTTRCQGHCSCEYPICCAALNGMAEDDLNTYQCVTKRSLSLDELWQLANPGMGAPAPEVALYQSSVKNLAQVITKLIANLLKVCSSLALYKYDEANTQALLTAEGYIDLGQRLIVQWLGTPRIPTAIQTLIVDRLVRQGLLLAFESSNLPSNCTEISPILPDPFTLIMPTPDTIAFHMAMCELYVTKLGPAIYQLCRQSWQTACDSARTESEFRSELTRTQATQLLSAVNQTICLFYSNNQSPVSNKKDGSNAEEDVVGPGALLSDLKACTTSSLRAMAHVHLLREIFRRPFILEGLLQLAVQMLSFPIGEVQTAAHHCIRSYAKLTWKRIGTHVVGSGIIPLTKFLDLHSKLLSSVFDNVLDFALIITANPPILDDPYATDVTLEIPVNHKARQYLTQIPPSLLHHVFSGKSSSSGSQLYAAVQLVGPNLDSQEIRWTANEGLSAYALSSITLYEIMKAAVQLFSLRCIHVILKKSSSHQLNNAELLSSVHFDSVFRNMILKMTDNAKYTFTLDSDTAVEWVTLLYQSKECRSVRENIKQFLLGNLKAVSAGEH